MKTLLTPEQVASQLSVETTTVYAWLRTSRLAGVKLGRLWRIRATDVERFTQEGWEDKKDAVEIKRNKNAAADWIDALPQIDMSDAYPSDAIFSREEIYDDDETERGLYSGLYNEVVTGSNAKGAKSKGRK